MKTLMKSLLILNCMFYMLCLNEAGVKIAVNKDAISGFERKFLPLLFEKLRNINIPDTSIDVDAGIGTLHIYLNDINLQFSNLLADNIYITFSEPNQINLDCKSINGQGHLNVRFKLGFISETDSIDVRINNLNAQSEATLTTQESKVEKGKIMPSAYLSKLNIDIDFDFDINGKLIAWIAGLVKSKIKSYINDQIQTRIRDLVMSESKKAISDLIDKLPVYVPLNNNGLALDYSLLSPPKVFNGYLILNSNGAIVDLNHPESKIPPFVMPTTLPDFDTTGKLIQLFVSDYSIKTAINSLFLSNMLEVYIRSEEMPKDSPIQLNTTSMETLIPGISSVYGLNKLVDVYIKVVKQPELIIKDGNINASLVSEIALIIRLDDGKTDEALRFMTTLITLADSHVSPNGQIYAQIHNAELKNSTIIQTKISDANINNIEIVFNFSMKIVIPIVNNKYLNNITIKLPSIEGITFYDSTVIILNDYVELNVNPQFNAQMLNNYLISSHKYENSNNNSNKGLIFRFYEWLVLSLFG